MINAKNAHTLASETVLTREYPKMILAKIEESAKNGQYQMEDKTKIDYFEINDLVKALRDLGYEANVQTGTVGSTLYVRW